MKGIYYISIMYSYESINIQVYKTLKQFSS